MVSFGIQNKYLISDCINLGCMKGLYAEKHSKQKSKEENGLHIQNGIS